MSERLGLSDLWQVRFYNRIIRDMKEYNKIPWKQIIGMRNRIVHRYDTINLEIVWNTSKESIPELKSYCEEILN